MTRSIVLALMFCLVVAVAQAMSEEAKSGEAKSGEAKSGQAQSAQAIKVRVVEFASTSSGSVAETKAPADAKPLASIEVLPDAKGDFFARCTIAGCRVTLRGHMSLPVDGASKVSVVFSYEPAPGQAASVDTVVAMKPGSELAIGGIRGGGASWLILLSLGEPAAKN